MGVEYFEFEALPGRRAFRCEKRQATITTDSCADLWRNAQDRACHERFLSCRGCQIGALHAGVAEATLSPLYASPTCARCHSGAMRLIRGHLCVSCANRQYEYRKGRNARGDVPVRHPTLHRAAVLYRSGGQVKRLARDDVADPIELVVAALRDEPRQVTFAMVPTRPRMAQAGLFA